ncbi:autotransporter outer membrane beta-barrel domain-containing protein [Novosphingobium sp. MW5]|nr:autotransporter outer membrane beta-barrel domain-containing protein [Novosphingobium sp. MW5]
MLEKFTQNPANSKQFGILQTFDPGATQVMGLQTLAGSISSQLDDPLSAYITERKEGDHQLGLWIRGGGGNFDQNLSTAFSATGFTGSANERVSTSFHTVQGGLDYGILGLGTGNFNLHFGITGGTFGGTAKGVNGQTEIDGDFLGGYVALTGGGLTFDATIRKEWRDYKMINPIIFAAGSATTKGDAWAGSVSGSYKIGLGTSGFSLTPSASLSWGSSSVDPFVVDTLSTVTLADDKQTVGRFGAKIAWTSPDNGGFVVEPYAGAYSINNFSRTEAGSATYGISTLSSLTSGFDNGVQYSAGISGHDASGKINVYVQGNLFRGGGLGGGSVTGGIRINF